MNELKSLNDFKDFTRRVHNSYALVNDGLELLGEKIESSGSFNAINTYEVIDEESEQLISSAPKFRVISGLKKDGPISQLVAHGLISFIYHSWEDHFRKMIAIEMNVEKNLLMCDLIGDIRLLRHKIAHNLGSIDKDIKKFKVITWLKEGHIILKSKDMNRIQIELNRMKVYVRSN